MLSSIIAFFATDVNNRTQDSVKRQPGPGQAADGGVR